MQYKYGISCGSISTSLIKDRIPSYGRVCFPLMHSVSAQFVASLTPQSVGLSPGAHERITPPTTPGNIRYLHIDQVAGAYSIGVFVLPPRACIPLHDHPNM